MRWPAFAKWPFVLRLIWDPIRALDLLDRSDKPDHGKVMPCILLASAIVGSFTGHAFPVASLIVLGSLAYGLSAWRAFLQSKSVTFTRTEADTEVRTIKATYDKEEHYQPSHE